MGSYHPQDHPELPSFSQRARGPAAWGGIGCVMAVLLPVLAYFAALVTLEYNKIYHWFALPPEFVARPYHLPISWAILILTVGYGVLFYAFYAMLYALLYRLLGITPYTPLDLDKPVRVKRRRSQMHMGALVPTLLFLLSFLGGIVLVHLSLARGWVSIPGDWRVPGPVPYAGVYLLVGLLLWALLWALWGVVQAMVSSLRRREEDDEAQW